MLRTVTTPLSELFIEHASKLEARRGYMFPADRQELLETRKDAGFRSVYMFDRDSAQSIAASQSSKGFKQYEVYSDRLYIDLDGGDEELWQTLDKLWGYGFYVYSSGSKGYHLELPHLVYAGPVAEAQMEFVNKLGLRADQSLYRPGSIIALPGRIHPKTGKRKELIMTFSGKQPVLEQPTLMQPRITEPITNTSFALMRAARLSEAEPVKGGRQTALWSLAKTLADAGFTYETTLELVRKVNDTWADGKPDSEILRAVSPLYRNKTR